MMALIEAEKRAQKKYNTKTITFVCSYKPTDIKEGKRLKAYLATTGQSANSYIKGLIRADLDSKGIAYVNEDETTDNQTDQ